MPDMIEPGAQPDLQTHLAHTARIYDYFLGGKDNYAADRAAGDATIAAWPASRSGALANRAFMRRAARFLAAECGVTQYLDIGTGIPTAPNLHQIAQGVAPESRVVYVDHDPIVLAHARALMVGTPQGATTYIQADLRDPRGILDAPELRATLDLERPVALLLLAIAHFVEDEAQAIGIVDELVSALPSGSYLALSTATSDFDPEGLALVQEQYHKHGQPLAFRTHAQVERLFHGLELVEPRIVQAHKWRPNPSDVGAFRDVDVAMYAGVARKP
ncbi:SAM-dependent methyltransferase [Pseudonocardia sp. GCM10023141]|uniref:SAM-dependent methyltransferase n=1 Tax=Pseudonocardia sp. GCM10023141 TaxID=3252653 RepID=UPI00361DAB13